MFLVVLVFCLDHCYTIDFVGLRQTIVADGKTSKIELLLLVGLYLLVEIV